MHTAHARDNARAGRVVVIHAPGGKSSQLEKRGPRIDQALDAFACRKLAQGPVPFERFWSSAGADARARRAQPFDFGKHVRSIGGELGAIEPNRADELLHLASLPTAAVGLEAAIRAPPDRVHAINVAATAALTHHCRRPRRLRIGIREERSDSGQYLVGAAQARQPWRALYRPRKSYRDCTEMLSFRHKSPVLYEKASVACYSPVSASDISLTTVEV